MPVSRPSPSSPDWVVLLGLKPGDTTHIWGQTYAVRARHRDPYTGATLLVFRKPFLVEKLVARSAMFNDDRVRYVRADFDAKDRLVCLEILPLCPEEGE